MIKVGSLLDGKYRILDEVGHGGMSVVYMARNEKANKTWAVKVVRKDGKLDFNTVRAGLVAEIETLKNLSHPNLPSIVDVIEDDESFIIVMDFIEGNSLDKILEENGAQPEEYVVEWAMQLCDVLGYLHSRTPPIIYRDMKPANIMLKPDGNITVIDFGTAKTYDIDLGQTTGIGTIGYAAPEQYRGSGYGRTDARTDIYCLGMTLYHLLTGVDPCKNIIADKSIRAINPSLSVGLDMIIQKCIQEHPDARYQSCAELMYDLQHYKDLEPIIKRRQKRKLITFSVVTILSIMFAVTGVFLYGYAQRKATDNYEETIEKADGNSNYNEQKSLYEEAINIPGQDIKTDAYLKLLAAYDKDGVFSIDEVEQLNRILYNNEEYANENRANSVGGDPNKETKARITKFKEKNPSGYAEVCFDIGSLYWYSYYEPNQVTRAQNSIYWFNEAYKNSADDFEDRGAAKTYVSIGEFYRDIQSKVNKGKEKGMYKDLFANLQDVMDSVAKDENETEKVRLDALDFIRSCVHQYATKFKTDGISETEVNNLYNDIVKCLEGINASEGVPKQIKAKIMSFIPNTKEAIETAYGTRQETSNID